MDADSRVLPFTLPVTIEVYERENPKDPWRKQRDLATLIADDQRLVRVKDGVSGDTYSFHQLEPRRFLVEAWMKSSGRFTYGVLDMQNGEGLLHHLLCENVDEAAFKAAGGIVTGINFKECNLDKVSNALALVKSMAAKPVGSQQRYVPVR